VKKNAGFLGEVSKLVPTESCSNQGWSQEAIQASGTHFGGALGLASSLNEKNQSRHWGGQRKSRLEHKSFWNDDGGAGVRCDCPLLP
jgi:hypothetical protein